MENSKIPFLSTRLPGSSKLPPATTRSAQQNANLPRTDNLPCPAPKRLKRRSNSCSDLRHFGTTPLSRPKTQLTANLHTHTLITTTKTNLKTIPEKVVTTSRTGFKRAAATTTTGPTEAKISRPAKIPAYDYKARYNLQVEKYKMLQQTLLDKESELNNAKLVEQQNDNLIQELRQVSSKYEMVNDLYRESKKENDDILKKKQDLEENFSIVQERLDKLSSDYENLLGKYSILKEKLEKVQMENNSFSENNDELNKKLLEALKVNKTQQELIEFYQTSIQEYENTRRSMHNQIQDLKGNVRVFCRVRPPLSSENSKLLCNFAFVEEDTLEIKKCRENVNSFTGKIVDSSLEFVFDKVFQPETSQMEVFEELSQLIQSAMNGYNVCVFAYGQTGSGKTYTMQGEDNRMAAGMIPRTVDLIFELVMKYQHIGWNYTVEVSVLEIYNETIRDLLNPQNKEQLDICFNEGKGTTVKNLSVKPVYSCNELRNLMSSAIQYRAVAVTNFNEHSSRSHAVTKITLKGIHEEIRTAYSGSLSLVDLAGSESAKTSTSERILETKNINKSLSALGSVMIALQNKEQHIPYRNSKLTYLLQSSLGGNSKTLMFVNIAPFEECYSESVNALRFASKVKEVKLISKKNKSTIKA